MIEEQKYLRLTLTRSGLRNLLNFWKMIEKIIVEREAIHMKKRVTSLKFY